MAEEQEVTPGTETNATPAATGGNTVPQQQEERRFTQAEVERLITERLSRETKKYADYDKTKAELKRLQEASKSDVDRLQETVSDLTAKFTEAENRARANLVKSAIVASAARLDFNDPQDAFRLLDAGGFEVADDGSVEGLEATLQKLLAEKPYLRKQAVSRTSPTNPASTAVLTMDQIKTMSPAEINSRWDDVQKVMAKGR
jgi:hypothetical protein